MKTTSIYIDEKLQDRIALHGGFSVGVSVLAKRYFALMDAFLPDLSTDEFAAVNDVYEKYFAHTGQTLSHFDYLPNMLAGYVAAETGLDTDDEFIRRLAAMHPIEIVSLLHKIEKTALDT